MTVTKVKVRPSSSGFMVGKQVHTTYPSGCLRHMKVSRVAPYQPIDPIYQDVGAVHEERYEQTLGNRLLEREYVIKHEISEIAEYTGRCDFIDIDGAVHETKATLSKTSKASIITKGQININHLSQLTSYLVHLERMEGYIIVGYYETDPTTESFVCVAERTFKITINTRGAVLIDGEESTYTVHDYLKHEAAQVTLDTVLLPERPYQESRFKSPCMFCPFNVLCDEVDIGLTPGTEFVSKALDILKTVVPRPVKVNTLSKKAKKELT